MKILISACLMGEKVRYDGGHCFVDHPQIKKWAEEERLVILCPEVSGGAPTPRPPSEIVGEWVLTNKGQDNTEIYQKGAALTVDLAKKEKVIMAILKSKSPSCGNKQIYSGNFDGSLISGSGITAKALMDIGIKVFNENEIEEATQWMASQDII